MATSNTFDRAFLARYRRVYNTLIDVDDAYAKLRRHRRQLATIRKTLRIIRSQRANDYLGVTLLHRHFRAEPGAVFVERRFTPRARGHKTVLVTCPIPASRTPVRLAPHRFTFTGGGKLQPLEFTTDPAAIRAHARLADDEQLQAKVAEVIAESGLGSMLGVGIYARERSIAKATSVFLEETRFAQRQSVVHVLPRLPPAPRRPIPTLWVSGLDGDLFCETICLAYCSHEPSLGIGYCGHVKGQHVGKT
jgi:hypothetical protein